MREAEVILHVFTCLCARVCACVREASSLCAGAASANAVCICLLALVPKMRTLICAFVKCVMLINILQNYGSFIFITICVFLTRTGFDAEKLLMLLLLTAQFEFTLKSIFEALLAAKKNKWEKCRKEAEERMKELGDYFR